MYREERCIQGMVLTWFWTSAGDLGMYPLWIRGTMVQKSGGVILIVGKGFRKDFMEGLRFRSSPPRVGRASVSRDCANTSLCEALREWREFSRAQSLFFWARPKTGKGRLEAFCRAVGLDLLITYSTQPIGSSIPILIRD